MKPLAPLYYWALVVVISTPTLAYAIDPDTFSQPVSFLYEEAIDAPGTNTTIMSPAVSFLYPEAIDIPGLSIVSRSAYVSFLYLKLPEDDYLLWAAEKFTQETVLSSSTDWQQSSDPDHDGKSNLHEYLFGTSPLDGQSLPVLRIERTIVNLEQRPCLRWNERRAVLALSMTYSIESSTDLRNWLLLPVSLGTISRSDAGGGYDLVTFTFNSANIPNGFFHLNVQ